MKYLILVGIIVIINLTSCILVDCFGFDPGPFSFVVIIDVLVFPLIFMCMITSDKNLKK